MQTFNKKHLLLLNKSKAFTLSETLITLVIVGVVAALTIPNLIVKYQKEQTVTRLKKVYSTLSQATDRAIADYGPISTWDIDTKRQFNKASSKLFFKKYLQPYLSFYKVCIDSNETCTAFDRYGLDNTPGNNIYKGTTGNWALSKGILNDGTFIAVYTFNGSACIIFDINGDKKPNLYGKDTFQLCYSLQSNKLAFPCIQCSRAVILSNPEDGCNKKGVNVAGKYCGALIQKDGWKISDDYPW